MVNETECGARIDRYCPDARAQPRIARNNYCKTMPYGRLTGDRACPDDVLSVFSGRALNHCHNTDGKLFARRCENITFAQVGATSNIAGGSGQIRHPARLSAAQIKRLGSLCGHLFCQRGRCKNCPRCRVLAERQGCIIRIRAGRA